MIYKGNFILVCFCFTVKHEFVVNNHNVQVKKAEEKGGGGGGRGEFVLPTETCRDFIGIVCVRPCVCLNVYICDSLVRSITICQTLQCNRFLVVFYNFSWLYKHKS